MPGMSYYPGIVDVSVICGDDYKVLGRKELWDEGMAFHRQIAVMESWHIGIVVDYLGPVCTKKANYFDCRRPAIIVYISFVGHT
jgi:hypothetical protein